MNERNRAQAMAQRIHFFAGLLATLTAPRLRRWLRNKFKLRRRSGGTYPLPHLYGYFGLVSLSGRDCGWTCAKA
jgi:hypothetical protein